MSKTCRDICLEIWRQREMSRHVATFAKTRVRMPLPCSEGRISVKSQESRPKKFCAIIAFLTSLFAILAAFSRFSRTFESKNMLSDRARPSAARGAKIFTQEAKCHVVSRHLPGIRAPSCHVASRHLPRSRRNMTLTFALDPRDILGRGNHAAVLGPGACS